MPIPDGLYSMLLNIRCSRKKALDIMQHLLQGPPKIGRFLHSYQAASAAGSSKMGTFARVLSHSSLDACTQLSICKFAHDFCTERVH